jgi:hypothetical protein
MHRDDTAGSIVGADMVQLQGVYGRHRPKAFRTGAGHRSGGARTLEPLVANDFCARKLVSAAEVGWEGDEHIGSEHQGDGHQGNGR